MRKKGFTLIELLAVIAILAIIALIATPIIINIISDARKESGKRSVELYASAVKNAVEVYKLNNPTSRGISGVFTTEDGKTLTNGQCELTVEYNGNVKCTTTEIYEDGNIYLAGCTVNGNDTDYAYGVPAPKSFAEDSWETIAANVKAGNLSKYKVGDTKEIALKGYTNGESNSKGLYTVRIANTSTPEECNQEGFSQSACGFVIEFVDLITNYNMNSSDTNKGGWEYSTMRQYVNDRIYNALPQELQGVIADTTVVSSHGSYDSTNFTTKDKLYLLSLKEVWGNETYARENNVKVNVADLNTASQLTRQLDYYLGISLSDPNRLIKKYDGSASVWYLRSCSWDKYFNIIYLNGLYSNVLASTYSNFSPVFRIG